MNIFQFLRKASSLDPKEMKKEAITILLNQELRPYGLEVRAWGYKHDKLSYVYTNIFVQKSNGKAIKELAEKGWKVEKGKVYNGLKHVSLIKYIKEEV